MPSERHRVESDLKADSVGHTADAGKTASSVLLRFARSPPLPSLLGPCASLRCCACSACPKHLSPACGAEVLVLLGACRIGFVECSPAVSLSVRNLHTRGPHDSEIICGLIWLVGNTVCGLIAAHQQLSQPRLQILPVCLITVSARSVQNDL